MTLALRTLAALTVIAITVFAAHAQQPQRVSQQEAETIAAEAFIYLYPLVTMDVSRRQLTNIEAGKMTGRGPMNSFSHIREFPDANFREVVRPNFDTLYSSGWLDLTKEPIVVSAPDTQGRYYLLPMLDMWSDVFAVPGKRNSGTTAANWAVVPPGWSGKLPAGVERINAPTPYVWIIGRTQTHARRTTRPCTRCRTVTGWCRSRNGARPRRRRGRKIDPSVDMKTPPLRQVNDMPADKYFAYGAELMRTNPPHATDWSTLARMKRIGIEPGKFDAGKVDQRGARAWRCGRP